MGHSPDVYSSERVVLAFTPFSCAQFVSHENARIYEETFPFASETVRNSAYVNDWLGSTKGNDIAIHCFTTFEACGKKQG